MWRGRKGFRGLWRYGAYISGKGKERRIAIEFERSQEVQFDDEEVRALPSSYQYPIHVSSFTLFQRRMKKNSMTSLSSFSSCEISRSSWCAWCVGTLKLRFGSTNLARESIANSPKTDFRNLNYQSFHKTNTLHSFFDTQSGPFTISVTSISAAKRPPQVPCCLTNEKLSFSTAAETGSNGGWRKSWSTWLPGGCFGS